MATAIALQPKAVVLENVPDVIRDSKNVVETGKALFEAAGYHTSTKTLSAHDMGLAQTRRRFFLVASRANPPPLGDVESALSGRSSDVKWAIEDLLKDDDALMSPFIDSSPETLKRIEWLFENDAYDLPDHMRPECHRNGHTYGSVYGRLRWNEPAGTITTGFMTMGRGRFVHPRKKRTLTPKEAARLQSFPDWYKFSRDVNDAPSKKDLCKWIGDAVPPMLSYSACLAAIASLEED